MASKLVLLPLVVLVLICVAASLVAGPALSQTAAVSWKGDTVHSFVQFKVKHLGVSYVYGRFNDFTIAAKAGEDGSALSEVRFEVKTTSVDTGNTKRDDHLRSADFLDAKLYSEMSFKSTSVKSTGKGEWEVAGELNLHGVNKPVTAKATLVGTGKGMKNEALVGYEATFTIKRTDFGMSKLLEGVGDEVHVTIAVELAKS